jgi:hypothetical protein
MGERMAWKVRVRGAVMEGKSRRLPRGRRRDFGALAMEGMTCGVSGPTRQRVERERRVRAGAGLSGWARWAGPVRLDFPFFCSVYFSFSVFSFYFVFNSF